MDNLELLPTIDHMYVNALWACASIHMKPKFVSVLKVSTQASQQPVLQQFYAGFISLSGRRC